MAATEMNFGPEWLRALTDKSTEKNNNNNNNNNASNNPMSSGSMNSSNADRSFVSGMTFGAKFSTTAAKAPTVVKYRYSCEEMLDFYKYYAKTGQLGKPRDLAEHEEVFVEENQYPLAFIDQTPEEIALLSQSINCDFVLKKQHHKSGGGGSSSQDEPLGDFRERLNSDHRGDHRELGGVKDRGAAKLVNLGGDPLARERKIGLGNGSIGGGGVSGMFGERGTNLRSGPVGRTTAGGGGGPTSSLNDRDRPTDRRPNLRSTSGSSLFNRMSSVTDEPSGPQSAGLPQRSQSTITSPSMLVKKSGSGVQRSSTEGSSSMNSINTFMAPWRTAATTTNSSVNETGSTGSSTGSKLDWKSGPSDASKNWRADPPATQSAPPPGFLSKPALSAASLHNKAKDFFAPSTGSGDPDGEGSDHTSSRYYRDGFTRTGDYRKPRTGPVGIGDGKSQSKPFSRNRYDSGPEQNDLFKTNNTTGGKDPFDMSEFDDRDLFSGSSRTGSTSSSTYQANKFNDIFSRTAAAEKNNSTSSSLNSRYGGGGGRSDSYADKWSTSNSSSNHYGGSGGGKFSSDRDRERAYRDFRSGGGRDSSHYRSNSHNHDESVSDDDDRRSSLPEWSLEDPSQIDVTKVGTFDASGAFHEASFEEDGTTLGGKSRKGSSASMGGLEKESVVKKESVSSVKSDREASESSTVKKAEKPLSVVTSSTTTTTSTSKPKEPVRSESTEKPKIDYFNDPSLSPNYNATKQKETRLAEVESSLTKFEKDALRIMHHEGDDEEVSKQIRELLKEDEREKMMQQQKQASSSSSSQQQQQQKQHSPGPIGKPRATSNNSNNGHQSLNQSSNFGSGHSGNIFGFGSSTVNSGPEGVVSGLDRFALGAKSSIFTDSFGLFDPIESVSLGSSPPLKDLTGHSAQSSSSVFSTTTMNQSRPAVSLESAWPIDTPSDRLATNLLQQHQSQKREPEQESRVEAKVSVVQQQQLSNLQNRTFDDPSTNGTNKWFYRDPQGQVQGPFSSIEMLEWFKSGYFQTDLLVRRAIDDHFTPLGDLMSSGPGTPFDSPPAPISAPVVPIGDNQFFFPGAPGANHDVFARHQSLTPPEPVLGSASVAGGPQVSSAHTFSTQPVSMGGGNFVQPPAPIGSRLESEPHKINFHHQSQAPLQQETSFSANQGLLSSSQQAILQRQHSAPSPMMSGPSVPQQPVVPPSTNPTALLQMLTPEMQMQFFMILKNDPLIAQLPPAQQQQVMIERLATLVAKVGLQPSPIVAPPGPVTSHGIVPNQPPQEFIPVSQLEERHKVDEKPSPPVTHVAPQQVPTSIQAAYSVQQPVTSPPAVSEQSEAKQQQVAVVVPQQAQVPQSSSVTPTVSNAAVHVLPQFPPISAPPSAWENLVPGALSVTAVEELQKREAEERYRQLQKQNQAASEPMQQDVREKREEGESVEDEGEFQPVPSKHKNKANRGQPSPATAMELSTKPKEEKITPPAAPVVQPQQQLPQMPQLPKKSVWGQQGTMPVESTPTSTLSIAEIQKLQEEKERQEEEARQKQLQQQMEFLAQQQANQARLAAGGAPMKWASNAWQGQNGSGQVKTLAEIQAEEAEKAATMRQQQLEMERRRNAALVNASVPSMTPLSAIVAKGGSMASSGASAWNKVAPAAPGTTSGWEEDVQHNQSRGARKVDCGSLRTILKSTPRLVKKLEDTYLNKFAPDSLDDLCRCSVEVLRQHFEQIDAPAFINIIKDGPLPSEMPDYVHSYLGHNPSATLFSQFFTSHKRAIMLRVKQQQRTAATGKSNTTINNHHNQNSNYDDEEYDLRGNSYKTALGNKNAHNASKAAQNHINNHQSQHVKPAALKVQANRAKNCEDINMMTVQVETMEAFDKWCTDVLNQNFEVDMDVDIFINFLKEIDSPDDINDYVYTYLGNNKLSQKFATNFISKRSYLRNKAKKSESYEDMCGPAPALNPSLAQDSASFVTVSSSSKKKRKGKPAQSSHE